MELSFAPGKACIRVFALDSKAHQHRAEIQYETTAGHTHLVDTQP
jgi:hypothetical protein